MQFDELICVINTALVKIIYSNKYKKYLNICTSYDVNDV